VPDGDVETFAAAAPPPRNSVLADRGGLLALFPLAHRGDTDYRIILAALSQAC
jgi:hypothetical protein